eukprot:Gb_27548 [translate_table: standard]
MESWSSLASLMATVMFIRAILQQFLPKEFTDYVKGLLSKAAGFISSYISIIIEEYDEMEVSEVYESVQMYLGNKSSSGVKRMKLKKPKNRKEFTFSMDKNQQIIDEYQGIKVWWVLRSTERKSKTFSGYSVSHEQQYYKFTFHKRDKQKVFEVYIPHIMAEAKALELKTHHRKIYTNKGLRMWTPVIFDHPATFDTLALEPEQKQDIIEDLQKFKIRENYYKKVGKAWKRGYLLYGPPGTGKSSMIAAIANLLDYDIYDLELTEVKSNTQLRKLLITTTNKSIIVIEDIDCSLDLSDRKKKAKKKKEEKAGDAPGKSENEEEESRVTLSGVLNFTDGLWSCCGSERLIIFTTNHIDRLDPALLRSGRMDKHIHLSFCTFPAFKVLACNYLGIQHHSLFEDIQVLMSEAHITPADVTEELMIRSDNPTSALENLIQVLHKTKEKAALPIEIPAHENATEECNLDAEEPPQSE